MSLRGKIGMILLLLAGFHGMAMAASERKVDNVALAALLIRDGEYQRASEALDKVDPNDDKIDRKRYYILRGLVSLKSQNFSLARDSFLQVIEREKNDKIIHVYLAQAYYGLKDYPEVLRHIELAGETGGGRPRLWLLHAITLWEMGRLDAAWEILGQARERFPQWSEFLRRQVFLLIDMGLYQHASEKGMQLVSDFSAGIKDYLAIGKALAQSGQLERALAFLEQAHLLYPGDRDTAVALAQVYVKKQNYQAAASILEQAAFRYPALWGDAAELWRRAKQPMRGLFINSMVLDQKKKYKQRLALLLEAERFDDVVEMEDDLYRAGLLSDQNILYALAYASYRTGLFLSAHQYLDEITQPKLFARAATLRSAMEACDDTPWLCID